MKKETIYTLSCGNKISISDIGESVLYLEINHGEGALSISYKDMEDLISSIKIEWL